MGSEPSKHISKQCFLINDFIPAADNRNIAIKAEIHQRDRRDGGVTPSTPLAKKTGRRMGFLGGSGVSLRVAKAVRKLSVVLNGDFQTSNLA